MVISNRWLRLALVAGLGVVLVLPLYAAGRYYYMADGKRIDLTVRTDMISVGFAEGTSDAQKEEIAARFTVLSDPGKWIKYPEVGITQIPFRERTTLPLVESTVSALQSLPEVQWCTPSFEINKQMYLVSDRFIVKFLPDLTRGSHYYPQRKARGGSGSGD